MANTTVTITLPTATLPTLVAAICANYNYQVNGGGLTQQQFALSQLKGWLTSQVDQYNSAQAQAAGQAALVAAQETAVPVNQSTVAVTSP